MREEASELKKEAVYDTKAMPLSKEKVVNQFPARTDTPRRGMIPKHPNQSAQQAWTKALIIVGCLAVLAGGICAVTTPGALRLIDALGAIPYPSP